MKTLKPLFLIILGSLLFNANYAQCPIGQTEITIQFTADGSFPDEVSWDYKIQGVLSESGPYTISDIITTCAPVGDLTIVGCDTAGDTWNGAIFQVTLSNDTTSTTCPIQNGCYLYTSTFEDANKVPHCSTNSAYEITNINIGTCEGTPVIISGCTNPLAINYSECAIIDNDSCKIPTTNNNCSDARFVAVHSVDNYKELPDTVSFLNNSLNIEPACDSALQDAFFRFVVPPSGKIWFTANRRAGISLFNTCNQSSIFCESITSDDFEVDFLTPGDTLILQIFNNNPDRDIIFNLVEAIPSLNNDCSNAQRINVAPVGECISNQIEVNFNFNSVNKIPDCNTDIIADAFYEIVVPNSGSFRYASDNGNPHGLSLYNTCTGSAIACKEYTNKEIFKELTPGDTLILQVFTYFEETNYSFCIEEVESSSNNNCIDAEWIEVAKQGNCEKNQIEFSNLNYNTADIQPDCDSEILYDAFYQLVVPTTGQILFSSEYALGIAFYSTCNQAPIFCADNISFKLINDLSVGDTLILQIFENNYQSDFSFCLEAVTPSDNNDCSNPKFIEVADLNNYMITIDDTLSLKNNTINIEPNCDFAEQDAFYQFVVPQSGKVLFSTSQTVGISLYKSCDETSIYCKGKNHRYTEIENLTPLDTLILQIFDTDSYENMQFSLSEITPTINDNCTDAPFITVASSGTCEMNYIDLNLNYNTLNNEPNCESSARADAYYQFVVPNSGSIRYFAPSANAHGFSIYDSCNFDLIVCDDYASEELIRDLIPGDTLILQIFNRFQSDFHSFCIEEVIPSANNACLNAQPIEVAKTGSCEGNTIELLNFHYNKPSTEPQCDQSILYDAFYEFIVPPSGNILFACNFNVGISIYNSCDTTSLYCNRNLEYGVIDDLPVGETLILQIFDDYKNSVDLRFCVEEVRRADNNDCSNAELITVADFGNCEMHQVNVPNLSYNTPDIQPKCDDEILYDVYYKFVVPPSGQVLFSADSDVGVAFYNTCNESSIVCNKYLSFGIIRDLPVGDTLLLQIFEDNFQDDFSFCLEDAVTSVNDNCVDAIPITIAQTGNCETHQVNLSYLYYNSADIQPECRDEALPDVFYEFTVPPSGSILFSTEQYMGFSIFNSCTGESLWCYENGSYNIAKNLPPGETVILQIFIYTYFNEISFCLEEVSPSLNNYCIDALPITVAQSGNCEMQLVNLSNFNYNSFNIQPRCESDILYDAFYELTIPPSGQIRVKTENNPGVAIYSACDGISLFCEDYNRGNIIRNLPAGESVILQIFEDSNYPSDISFCVEAVTPSINNNCVDATPITVAESGNCSMHQLSIANLNYNSANIEPNCQSSIFYDAFYEFVVPETGQVLFLSDEDVGITIYQACNSSSLYCKYNAINETIRNLPAGETLILQIFDNSTIDFRFCLEESIPILNNLCINAEPFIVNEPGACEGNYIPVLNTSNNTDINPYCASYVMADAFYSFIVPASGHISISTSKVVGISIYDDCLEQSYYCNSSFRDQVIYGLNPADTLILQAFQTENPDDFELCLEDAPPSINNDCADATPLQIYSEGECEGNLIVASNHNNSVSINPSCESISADIFYKVTIPENGQFRITRADNTFGLSIYTACNTNALYCVDYINTNHLIQGLPANEEVLLQFYQNEGPGDFELCIEEALPTANNDCSNAIPVDVVPVSDVFERTNTLNLKNNTINMMSSCNSIISDAFYELTVPENGKIAINMSDDFGVALYKDCDSESIVCDQYTSYMEIISDLPAGETLILKLFKRSAGQNDLTFSISEVMDNNTCKNAAALCEPTTSGTNLLSYPEVTFDRLTCNESFQFIYNTAWYSFETNESGDQISFEITKGACYNYNYIFASILSSTCDTIPVSEDCIALGELGEKATLTLENPVANQQYYLIVTSDYDNEYCNFEINVLEGIEYDCCQFDYSLDAWCNNNNPENYFVDVTINNFGYNPSGYRIAETNNRVTAADSTITIGPIPNGTNTITLLGIDQQNCVATEAIDFNCTDCEEHILHNNTQIKRGYDFNASKTIESNIQVMPSTSLKYSAGDSIILKYGFTVEKGADFSIDIEDCE